MTAQQTRWLNPGATSAPARHTHVFSLRAQVALAALLLGKFPLDGRLLLGALLRLQ
jgi:hypothetical protein